MENDASDRTLILRRLNRDKNFNEYIDSLFNIFHSINNARKTLSSDIKESFMVMGGMLYFIFVREAELLGIIEDDIDSEIYSKFKEYKTVDLDAQGHIRNTLYEEEEDLFVEDSKKIKQNYFHMMNSVYSETRSSFEYIHKILHNKSVSSEKVIGENFGLGFIVAETGDHISALECRPQITVRVGKEEDHILEVLILVNFDTPITELYDLKCMEKPFVGESIVVSMTQQIFPNERAWLDIDKTKTANEIFSDMRRIFEKDSLQLTKFSQGFYRSYMIYYVFLKAHKFGIHHLLNIMIPTNNVLLNKLFFLKGNFMRKIASKEFISEVSSLSEILRSQNKNEKASFENTKKFMVLNLELWKYFNKKINGGILN
ncbi:hypothetical protein IIV31_072L [Armadillidium vulgare iridescent virus]|uniref:Uncharacterized protein n=1 Tax=Armadillidium vulgare iridescent virus TaxID=72201 RepID=A0A068QLP6_9VIRU|nr:hypothetical protein IIV31_072L [Armadillidium vulgare iridescent virus]CCV02444.1 hypothetical protein IIV31_072L [Armadillidium vulgare iridescent virus]